MEKPVWRRARVALRRRLAAYAPARRRTRTSRRNDRTRLLRPRVRGFVVVVALTADDRVVLVRQYRYGATRFTSSFPPERLNDGEEPRDCALRELAEETGYEVARCELVGGILRGTGAFDGARLRLRGMRRRAKPARPRWMRPKHIEVELASLAAFRAMLARRQHRRGRLDRRRLPRRSTTSRLASETCRRQPG